MDRNNSCKTWYYQPGHCQGLLTSVVVILLGLSPEVLFLALSFWYLAPFLMLAGRLMLSVGYMFWRVPHVVKTHLEMGILQNWSCALLQESNMPHLLGVCISVYGWSRISRILSLYWILGGTKVSLEQRFRIWCRDCLWLSAFLKV